VVLQACPLQSQWVLVVLTLFTSALLAAHTWRLLPFGTRPAELRPGDLRTSPLDLNTASAEELTQLPGIGPILAEQIVAYRQKHGPFKKLGDLDRIKGIGPATMKRLEGWVYLSGQDEPPVPEEDQPLGLMAAAKAAPGTKPAAATQTKPKKVANWQGPKININTASAEELVKLPGIGPVLAQRIIDERHKMPFQSILDIQRVKGIKSKIFAGMQSLITVGD
jgi:competence protein ComEA